MKKNVFISGIDTDCGKTYITGLLAYHLFKAKINVITTKFVQTGCSGISEDIEEHRRIMEMDILPEDKERLTCPFVYSFAASPHLSAQIDKRPFCSKIIDQSIKKLSADYDIILTEGAGGLAVPISTIYKTSDYIIDNKLPLILVSSSKLGSINHTILSISYCMQNKINLIAIIYNFLPGDNVTIANESFTFLESYLDEISLDIKLIHSNDLVKENDFDVINCLGL